jgi:hypothetical protein
MIKRWVEEGGCDCFMCKIAMWSDGYGKVVAVICGLIVLYFAVGVFWK